jgi:serine protease Do
LEDTPAANAGLQQDDVLVSWNGARLEGVAQLQRHMRERPAGRSVRLGVFRDGKARDVNVTLGKREGMTGAFVGPDGVLGFRVDPTDQERLRERMDELRVRMRDLRDRVGPEGEAVRAYWMAISERGRLGVSIQNLGDQLAQYFGVEQGALITSVLEDSPAQRAGLKAGDVIVGIAGEGVEGPADVMRALRDREAGPVDLRIMRDRKARTISVELEERQSGASCVGEKCEEGSSLGRIRREPGEAPGGDGHPPGGLG